MTDLGPPDYGTARDAVLKNPRGTAFLVFTPHLNGTSQIVAFGHGPANYDRARERAARNDGLVVRMSVLADFGPECGCEDGQACTACTSPDDWERPGGGG